MECSLFCCAMVLLVVYQILSRLVRKLSVGRYSERYILVTGCDTGFGYEIAKRLDSLGCHVFAGCLTEKGETELKKTSSSQRLHTISLDVSQEKSIREAFDYVKQQLPQGTGLWGVLNNAGVSYVNGRVEWWTIANYKDTAAVNLYGLIDVTMTFLPLVKKERGRIVNTSSIGGRISVPTFIPYGVSKYGVEAFTDGLRRSLRPYRCEAILIEPGAHATNMMSKETAERSFERAWNQATPEIKEEFGEEFRRLSAEQCSKAHMKGTAHPSQVVDAYEHALLGRYPRARYVVGWDAQFILLPIQWLPEWLGDWILEKLAPDTPLPAILKKRQ